MDTITLFMVFLLAFGYEAIDASTGQGYGTLGSPTLILLGFDPKIVVPIILISQAAGGLIGAFWQNHYKNVDFSNLRSADMKKVYFIIVCGIIGVIVASFVGFKISKDIMTFYIGAVVLTMGILIVSGIVLKFTWKRLSVIGAVSAFNKGLSGGGYGPVVAGGQVIIGVGAKNSIGITDFAEAPICLSGFITWTWLTQAFPPLDFMFVMILGAAVAPALGAWITYRTPTGKLKRLMGVIIIILGALCLLKVLNP